jgi:hypothetical protein
MVQRAMGKAVEAGATPLQHKVRNLPTPSSSKIARACMQKVQSAMGTAVQAVDAAMEQVGQKTLADISQEEARQLVANLCFHTPTACVIAIAATLRNWNLLMLSTCQTMANLCFHTPTACAFLRCRSTDGQRCRYALTSFALIAPMALAAAIAKPLWRFGCANVQRPVEFHDRMKEKLHRKLGTKQGGKLYGAVPWIAAVAQVRLPPSMVCFISCFLCCSIACAWHRQLGARRWRGGRGRGGAHERAATGAESAEVRAGRHAAGSHQAARPVR